MYNLNQGHCKDITRVTTIQIWTATSVHVILCTRSALNYGYFCNDSKTMVAVQTWTAIILIKLIAPVDVPVLHRYWSPMHF